jgi:hypothetical protein
MLVMLSFVLLFHSFVRWAVLLTGLVAAFRGIVGWRRRRPWTLADERAGFWFTLSLDIQFLLGLLLYFALSPITRAAFQDFGAAMQNSGLRFWAVEHVVGMFIGIALAHIGRTKIHKTGNDDRRHRLAAIFFTLSLLVIAASIPWPGTPNGRPLLRW